MLSNQISDKNKLLIFSFSLKFTAIFTITIKRFPFISLCWINLIRKIQFATRLIFMTFLLIISQFLLSSHWVIPLNSGSMFISLTLILCHAIVTIFPNVHKDSEPYCQFIAVQFVLKMWKSGNLAFFKKGKRYF